MLLLEVWNIVVGIITWIKSKRLRWVPRK